MTESGTIKWFDRKKGFGFVTPSQGGEDIFVHRQNINCEGGSPMLDEGDKICYNLGEHKGRPTAVAVTMEGGAPVPSPARRSRGRNAKKEADAEAAKDADTATASAAANDDANPSAEGGEKKSGGGRGGKPHRSDGRTRTRRNDKGAKSSSERSGDASSKRQERKSGDKQAARDSASAAADKE